MSVRWGCAALCVLSWSHAGIAAPDTPSADALPATPPSAPPFPAHAITELGVGYTTDAMAPDVIETPRSGGELLWTFGVEAPLPRSRFALGGILSLRTAAHDRRRFEYGVRGSFLIAPGLSTHVDAGSFTCDACRSVDPHFFVNLQLEYRAVSVFLETRVTAYDAFEDFRPLGTGVRMVVGASSTTWQGGIAVLAIEAIAGFIWIVSTQHEDR